jgi:hypothetical protein
MAKCFRCRNFKVANGDSFLDVSFKCKLDKHDVNSTEDIENYEVECDGFDSKYIEYPLEISGIEQPDGRGIRDYWGDKTGSLVKIRPCGDEYKGKTYLGVLIGEADVGLIISHNRETKMLSINRQYNPAIFVPELKKVIYGCESWWGIVKTEEELKDITDNDINNVWYVKLLRGMIGDKSKS